MSTSMTRFILKVRRYKKLIIVGITAGVVALTALVLAGAFMLLLSKPWQAPKDYLSQASTGISSSVTELANGGGGMVEQALFWAATSYVEATLQNAESQNYASALKCVASLGGPSPGVVIESVKSRVTDPQISRGLDGVLEKMKLGQDAGNNTQSCLNWFMNS